MTIEKTFKVGVNAYRIDGYIFSTEQVGHFPAFLQIRHYTRSAKVGSFPKFLEAERFDADEAGKAKGNDIFKALIAKGYKRTK